MDKLAANESLKVPAVFEDGSGKSFTMSSLTRGRRSQMSVRLYKLIKVNAPGSPEKEQLLLLFIVHQKFLFKEILFISLNSILALEKYS